MHRQAIEAARCFAEGVLEEARDADVGAILGWGFPRWTGGPLSYIEQIGIARFVNECDELATQYGSRFSPPDELREMARTQKTYYPTEGLNRSA
jgi:3-hydroxyacyl-CoA dehydrogenase/enoyl-CoA hydratase/3-hydroxybutyryl-CoA epimerase